MPVCLHSCSRRGFIKTVATATLGWVTVKTDNGGTGSIDPNYFVLMADTHIDVAPGNIRHGQNMYENLQRSIHRIRSRSPFPCGVIINGDCSFNIGEHASYVLLKELVQPLVEEGIGVYMSMGNHDHRANFYRAFEDAGEFVASMPDKQFVEGRHILIIDSGYAYMFVLDSLIHAEDVYTLKGAFGHEQLDWLDEALARHKDKPVHVFAHHYPNNAGLLSDSYGNGINDQDAFFNVLSNHAQVQSYIFGHSHLWEHGHSHNNMFDLVGQPATGYIFRDEQPLGYLHARLGPGQMDLKLEALDTNHPWHGQQYAISMNREGAP